MSYVRKRSGKLSRPDSFYTPPRGLTGMVKTVYKYKVRTASSPVATPPEDKETIIPSNSPVLMAIDFNDHRGLPALLKQSNNYLSFIDEDGNNLLMRAISVLSTQCAEFCIKHGICTDIRNKRNETPLQLACAATMESIIPQLIKNQNNVNFACYKGYTALHCATPRSSRKIVELLLENNAYVDCVTKDGLTPLMLASHAGNLAVTQALLHNNASVNSFDKRKRTAIHFAAAKGEYLVVNELLNHRAKIQLQNDLDETVLHCAAHSGNFQTFKLILRCCHTAEEVNQRDKHGRTVLHILALSGEADLLELLLSNDKLDISLLYKGRTALDLACGTGDAETMKLLSHTRTDDPQPLHISIMEHQSLIALYLMNSASKSINFLDGTSKRRKETALHIVARIGRTSSSFKVLISAGVDPARENFQGNNPLHIAAMYCNNSLFMALKEYPGNNIYSCNHRGRTLLHIAALTDNETLAAFLLTDFDIEKLNIPDNDGNIPLHLTTSIAIAQLLLSVTKNINLLNHGSLTPLDCAIGLGNFPIAFLILREQQMNPALTQISSKGENIAMLAALTNPKLWKASISSCPPITEKIDYQSINKYGITPLSLAAKRGEYRSVRFLLTCADVRKNCQDKKGWTALHYASAFGHVQCITELLAGGVDTLLYDKVGRTALHVCHYSKECLDALLSDPSQSAEQCRISDSQGFLPIHYACAAGDVNALDALLKHKSFKTIGDCEQYLHNVPSPIHIACQQGHETVLIYLLEKLSVLDPNLPDPINNETPLSIAIKNEYNNLVKVLVAHNKIKINQSNKFGITALHVAAEVGNNEAIQILIECNANVSVTDDEKELPLYKALANSNEQSANLLIAANSPITESFRTADKMTYLLYSAKLGNASFCLRCLERTTHHFCYTDEYKRGPLHYGAISGNVHCLQVLVQRMPSSCSINDVDSFGKTPLHYAVECNHLQVVAFLVTAGANLNIKCTEHKNTPMHLAVSFPHIYKYLKLHGGSESISNKHRLTPSQMIQGHSRGLRPRSDSLRRSLRLDKTKSGWVSAVIQPNANEISKRIVHSPKPQSFMRVNKRINTERSLLVSKTESKLCKALTRGDTETFSKCMVKQKKDLNFKDEQGNTPLILATIAKNNEYVSDLLASNANPNVNSDDGKNALYIAIEQEMKECISLLLIHDADPNVLVGPDSETVLSLAASRGDTKLIHQLISFNATVDTQQGILCHSALYIAAQCGHISAIKALLHHGASVNALSKGNFLAPLHAACVSGHPETVKFLLSQNADVDIRTVQKFTPLHLSVSRPQFDVMCKILVEYQADINAMDEDSITPLHLACVLGSTNDAKVLLQQNVPAKIDSKDGRGSLPIHHAAICGNFELLEVLLLHGANVIDVDSHGRTPLHLTCIHGNTAAAEFLLLPTIAKGGGNDFGVVTLADSDGKTPLYYAISNNHIDIIATFLGVRTEVRRHTIYNQSNSSTKLNNFVEFFQMAIDYEGTTILHKLVSYNMIDCFEVLLQKKIDIEACDDNGENVLMLACRLGYSEVVRILLDHDICINSSTTEGASCLQLSVESESLELVSLFFERIPELFNVCNIKDRSNIFHWIAGSSIAMKFFDLLDSSPQKPVTLPDIHQVDRKQRTPLHIACRKGNVPAITCLLELGAHIHVKDSKQFSAILCAAESGSVPAMKLLIEHGANISDKNIHGQNPLHCACIGGEIETVRFLHELSVLECDTDGNTPLHLSITVNAVEVCKLLSSESDINKQNKNGETALHIAARKKNPEIVSLLLSLSASTDIPDVNGMTSIHICAQEGATNCLKLLISSDANVHATTTDGRNALHFASEYSHESCVELLLDSNVSGATGDNENVNALHLASTPQVLSMILAKHRESASLCDNFGRLPIHIIVTKIEEDSHNSLIQILASYPDSIHSRSSSGKTPLHYATVAGRSDHIQLLLEHEADINAIDIHGYSSLHYATLMKHLECAEFLLDTGASTNLPCFESFYTPLHIAVSRNDIVLVRMLLDYGANTNTKDFQGNSPLHEAVLHGFEDCVELLLQHNANMTAVNLVGETALESCLQVCQRRLSTELFYLFLKFGFPLDYINPHGLYLIHSCCFVGVISWVNILLVLGVQIDLLDDNGLTPAMYAALGGNLNLLKFLATQQADFEIRSRENQTLLHFAVQSGNLDVVSWVLENYDSQELIEDDSKLTPLQYAGREFDFEVTEVLLRGLASRCDLLNKVDSIGMLPIHWASIISNKSLFEELVNRGCSPDEKTKTQGWNPLHCSLNGKKSLVETPVNRVNRLSFVKMILEGKYGKQFATERTSSGETCLHLLASLGDMELIKLFDGWDLLVNEVNDSGCSPLHFAVLGCSDLCVTSLLNHHADVNIVDNDGNCCLMKALTLLKDKSSANSVFAMSIIDALLARSDIDLYIINKKQESVFQLACLYGHFGLVQRIYQQIGDSVWKQTSMPGSSIHYAAYGGKLDIIQYLEDEGAPIDVINTNNANVLFYCVFGDSPAALELFLKLNVSHDRVYKGVGEFGGLNVTQVAALLGRVNCLRVLFRFVRDCVNMKTTQNDTLLHLAARRGNYHCLLFLLNQKSQKISLLQNAKNQTAADLLVSSSTYCTYILPCKASQ